jgi:hypothetical protein
MRRAAEPNQAMSDGGGGRGAAAITFGICRASITFDHNASPCDDMLSISG